MNDMGLSSRVSSLMHRRAIAYVGTAIAFGPAWFLVLQSPVSPYTASIIGGPFEIGAFFLFGGLLSVGSLVASLVMKPWIKRTATVRSAIAAGAVMPFAIAAVFGAILVGPNGIAIFAGSTGSPFLDWSRVFALFWAPLAGGLAGWLFCALSIWVSVPIGIVEVWVLRSILCGTNGP